MTSCTNPHKSALHCEQKKMPRGSLSGPSLQLVSGPAPQRHPLLSQVLSPAPPSCCLRPAVPPTGRLVSLPTMATTATKCSSSTARRPCASRPAWWPCLPRSPSHCLCGCGMGRRAAGRRLFSVAPTARVGAAPAGEGGAGARARVCPPRVRGKS